MWREGRRAKDLEKELVLASGRVVSSVPQRER